MLKKFLLAVLLMGFSLIATPIDNGWSTTIPLETVCEPIQKTMNNAYHKYGEVMVLMGEYDPDDKSQDVLLWNKKTKTYTLIEVRPVKYKGLDGKEHKDSLACILSTGIMKFDLRALADQRS